jgi:hypothetical protein
MVPGRVARSRGAGSADGTMPLRILGGSQHKMAATGRSLCNALKCNRIQMAQRMINMICSGARSDYPETQFCMS